MRRNIIRTVAWISFLLSWHLLSLSLNGSALPSPIETWKELITIVSGEIFLPTVYLTSSRALSAVIISVMIGSILVVFSRRSEILEVFKEEILFKLTLSIPPILWALISVVLFGLTPLGPVLVATLTVVPYYVLNLEEGISEIDQDKLEMGEVFLKSNFQNKVKYYRKVVLPLIYPYFVSSLRTIFSISWKIVLLGEIFTTTSGVGQRIHNAQQFYDPPALFAWSIVMLSLILATDKILKLCDERILRTYKSK